MARDRKRARQRQQRRPRPDEANGSARQNGGSAPVHENVSGELEHASGEVEEFDAALIAGAKGTVADPEPVPTRSEVDGPPADRLPAPPADRLPAQRPGATDDEPVGGDGNGEALDPVAASAPARGPRPEGNRIANFLRASWAELQRVQWPDRRQVGQATAVVLGFVAIAGAYLGLADLIASKIVDAIL